MIDAHPTMLPTRQPDPLARYARPWSPHTAEDLSSPIIGGNTPLQPTLASKAPPDTAGPAPTEGVGQVTTTSAEPLAVKPLVSRPTPPTAPTAPPTAVATSPGYQPPTIQTTAAPGAGTPAWTGGGAYTIMDYRPGMAETNREATTRTVGVNELTSRQLANLLDENGRYIRSARLGALEGANERGMLMSSFAVGAAERAAIEAGLPIAQSDASVYANTASENMRALNEDAMADQAQGRQLFGQAVQLNAQMNEAERNRLFQSLEAGAERSWRSSEAGLDRGLQASLMSMEHSFRGTQAEFDRSLQRALQGDQLAFQRAEASTERDWREQLQLRDREFTAAQNEQSRMQDRYNAYVNLMGAREQGLAQQLATIYSNTALTPAQQQIAANNARATFTSVASSFNAAFANGVPEIFRTPYQTPPPPPPTGG